MTGSPYTPETLAERWDCTARTVRSMLAQGLISGFKIGHMWRIPAHEVERFEACKTSGSGGTEASTPQCGTTKQDIDNAVRSAQLIGL